MTNWSDIKNNNRLKNILDERIKILKLVREYFWSKDFKEVETPIAVRYASQEPYLNPFTVNIFHPGGDSHEFFLHTSPEYFLKKLMAAGYEKIFEIAKCFRNSEDFGGSHNPEFTMLEWYRSGGELTDIMDDTEALFKFVLMGLGKNKLIYKNKEVGVFEDWDRVSLKEVFKNELNVDLDKHLDLPSIKELASRLGHRVAEDDEYEDVFFKIFLNDIEPKLGSTRPVFVYDYPAQMCSLSKLSEGDGRYAERFELYVGGLEIANAFGELTSAEVQKTRLERDMLLRKKLGKPVWPVDPDFISALRSGIGERASGVALGLDRMVVLCTGARDINEVIFGAVKDQL